MKPDKLERNDWEHLLHHRAEPSVSLFLPTHPPATVGQQGPVRLKNLLRQAIGLLTARGVSEEVARELLAPAQKLVGDPVFWQAQTAGLAMFLAAEGFRLYHLPLPFREQVVVQDRFFVKPLTPLLHAGDRFVVLALSLNQARVLEVTPHEATRLAVAGMPESFEEALGYPQFYSEQHVHALGPATPGHQPIVHGHGDRGDERLKLDIRTYFRLVAQALDKQLRHSGLPVLLATVEAHVPIFQAVHQHLRLIDGFLPGSPEVLTDHELASLARPLAATWFRREREAAIARFDELAGGPRVASIVDDVLAAAAQGKVEALFLRPDAELWGTFDSLSGRTEVHETKNLGDEDLLDRATVDTLAAGGRVYALPPETSRLGNLAAVLRYA